jgi:hypothetical protein
MRRWQERIRLFCDTVFCDPLSLATHCTELRPGVCGPGRTQTRAVLVHWVALASAAVV